MARPMFRPSDEDYNKDFFYEGEKMIVSVTIDQLIDYLNAAKTVLGGNCLVMIAGDDGAGYDEIRSIHGENFHDNLILTLSSSLTPERKAIIYLKIPE